MREAYVIERRMRLGQTLLPQCPHDDVLAIYWVKVHGGAEPHVHVVEADNSSSPQSLTQ